jgi:tRNA(Met) C34 N-acetyltransferase TmcA
MTNDPLRAMTRAQARSMTRLRRMMNHAGAASVIEAKRGHARSAVICHRAQRVIRHLSFVIPGPQTTTLASFSQKDFRP